MLAMFTAARRVSRAAPGVAAAPAVALAFTTAPSSAAIDNVPLALQPVVRLVDAGGATVTGASGTMTVSIVSGSGTLAGNTVSIVSGVATFTALKISGTPGAFTLRFSNGTLTLDSGTITLGAAVANPTALPVATGQVDDRVSYALLNVPAMAAGTYYLDPVTGLKTWKMTSATVPSANGSMMHEYSEGPTQISRQWGNKQYTLLFQNINSSSVYLVDFQRGVGFSNYRGPIANVQQITMSRNPATDPRIAFVTSLGHIRRFDTSVGVMAFADQGAFPLTFPFGSLRWFQGDDADDYFAAIASTADAACAASAVQGFTRTRTFVDAGHSPPGFDEPYLMKGGRYVFAKMDNVSYGHIWDTLNDTVLDVTPPPAGAGVFSHHGIMKNCWITNNSNIPHEFGFWSLASDFTTVKFTTGGCYIGEEHKSGQWQQAGTTQDYVLMSAEDESRDWGAAPATYGAATTVVRRGHTLVRLDGGDFRLCGHHYSLTFGAVNTGYTQQGGNYYSQPRTYISPDGTLLMFSSNMMDSPRIDVFVQELPIVGGG